MQLDRDLSLLLRSHGRCHEPTGFLNLPQHCPLGESSLGLIESIMIPMLDGARKQSRSMFLEVDVSHPLLERGLSAAHVISAHIFK